MKRAVPGSARVTRAGDGVLAIADFPCAFLATTAIEISTKVRFGATPKPVFKTDALPRLRDCAQIDGVTLICGDGNLL
jgi:hypothetical protein